MTTESVSSIRPLASGFSINFNGSAYALVEGAYIGDILGAMKPYTGVYTSITGTDPGFINVTLQNFRLVSGSAGINASTTLHSATTLKHIPVQEYRKHQRSELRKPIGINDLRAFECAPYAVWQEEEFGEDAENAEVSGEDADPDGDQISNFLEFAFLLDPNTTVDGAWIHPGWITIGEERYFTVEFQRRAAPSGIVYKTMFSGDLDNWSLGTVYSDTQAPTATAHTTDASADAETAGFTRVRLNTLANSEPRRFMRIEVEYE